MVLCGDPNGFQKPKSPQMKNRKLDDLFCAILIRIFFFEVVINLNQRGYCLENSQTNFEIFATFCLYSPFYGQ